MIILNNSARVVIHTLVRVGRCSRCFVSDSLSVPRRLQGSMLHIEVTRSIHPDVLHRAVSPRRKRMTASSCEERGSEVELV